MLLHLIFLWRLFLECSSEQTCHPLPTLRQFAELFLFFCHFFPVFLFSLWVLFYFFLCFFTKGKYLRVQNVPARLAKVLLWLLLLLVLLLPIL